MTSESTPTASPSYRSLFSGPGSTPEETLAVVVDIVKSLSTTADPREMIGIFGERVGSIARRDHTLSLTRRGLEPPQYRISRCSRWENAPDPWTEQEKLPVHSGGILGDLIFGNEPRILDDYTVAEDDPAYDLLHDVRSYLAMPTYDDGEALNMNIMLAHEPNAFRIESLAEYVWTSNLFGRAIHNLRVGEELKEAHARINREIEIVSGLQRSLLPKELPEIPTLKLAAYYETAQEAGGDYYDFFPFKDGTWGMLVADVCGHGPPATMLMGITHALVHAIVEQENDPAAILGELDRRLHDLYTYESRTFVTAMFARYDPASRTLTYSSAGHPPPAIRSCEGGARFLPEIRSFPLGIEPNDSYTTRSETLAPGDLLLFYTDGITEANNDAGEQFGEERLVQALIDSPDDPEGLCRSLLSTVEAFHGGVAQDDDCTLLALRVD